MRNLCRTCVGLFAALIASGCLVSTISGDAYAAEAANMLFKNGEDSATFQLHLAASPERLCPEIELLSATPNQQAIAQMLKDERNKNVKPGLVPPDDKDLKGIKIRFDGIRFVRDTENPDLVWIRLVGPINEFEHKMPLEIETLLTSKEPIPVKFVSVTQSTGVTVTISTDSNIQWQDGQLNVTGTKGSFDFNVGRFSPARILYASDSDSASLPDLLGKRVTEKTMPNRTLMDPEKLGDTPPANEPRRRGRRS